MILPIVAYGDPVLRKKCTEIESSYLKNNALVANMFETMYQAHGVGLAAPQIGLPIRLFVVDASPFSEDTDLPVLVRESLKKSKKVFINPVITKEEGTEWVFNEGCLSIPEVREDVVRKSKITIEYFDENFVKTTNTFEGLMARVIQHEYDHIEGVLFIDKISSLRKRLLSRRLNAIMAGKVNAEYRMRFPNIKK
jgi:peptide deformylase